MKKKIGKSNCRNKRNMYLCIDEFKRSFLLAAYYLILPVDIQSYNS